MRKLQIIPILILGLIFAYSCSPDSELREASPESVQVSAERLSRIDNMLQQSIDSGWIAGAAGFRVCRFSFRVHC